MARTAERGPHAAPSCACVEVMGMGPMHACVGRRIVFDLILCMLAAPKGPNAVCVYTFFTVWSFGRYAYFFPLRALVCMHICIHAERSKIYLKSKRHTLL